MAVGGVAVDEECDLGIVAVNYDTRGVDELWRD